MEERKVVPLLHRAKPRAHLSVLNSDCIVGFLPSAMSSASLLAAGSSSLTPGTTSSTSPSFRARSCLMGWRGRREGEEIQTERGRLRRTTVPWTAPPPET